MNQDSIYVFSNGGQAYFPSNTLTNFTNKFPIPLKLNETYEIGIQSIGFSSLFRNVLTPANDAPSLIVTNCNRSYKYFRNNPYKVGQSEGPVVWTFTEDTTKTCHNENDNDITVCENQKCFYSMFQLMDIEYSDDEVKELCSEISTKTLLDVKYEDRLMSFAIGQNFINKYGYSRCYIMMHDSFSRTFGFDQRSIRSYIGYHKFKDVHDIIRVMKVGSDEVTQHYVRKAYKDGVYYDVFYLDSIPESKQLQKGGTVEYTPEYRRERITDGWFRITTTSLNLRLVSNYIKLDRPPFPQTIKITCDAIQPQIYNNEYSNNMLVYTPDFDKLKNYTTEEIESVDFMPLTNTLLTDIRFQLLDEKNEQLQLLPGPATWIKMALRSKPKYKKSFNTVLTSEKSAYFDDNSQSSFRVKLPSPVNLDDNWKVCLSSLSHPSSFVTFLPHENETEKIKMKVERSIGFQKNRQPPDAVEDPTLYTLKANHCYEKEELVNEIKRWMVSENIGTCFINNKNVLNFSFAAKGTFILGETLARLLGAKIVIADEKIGGANVVRKIIPTTPDVYKCQNKINMSYLHPRYVMVYANIMQPVLVAGEYRKLLRISPIENTELDFITKYFRHKEYSRLENTIIDNIHIILASHDGRRIHFGSPQNVVINLEFTNHADDEL